MPTKPPYRCRTEEIARLRLRAERLTNKELFAQFDLERTKLALSGLLKQKDFPFIHLSGEVMLMIPAELYQVYKEEIRKRGLLVPNGAN